MEQVKKTGACILVEALIAQGTEVLFGFPGGKVLPIYDQLYLHETQIRHVLTCHEQHAAHAADGYARATGRVGVCLATSGPGATNLVTGIATAAMDSVPTVFITGNVSSEQIGTDGFQEADIVGITLPITKHNWFVKNIADLASIIQDAFALAKAGRPGPVLVDVPYDVLVGSMEIKPLTPVLTPEQPPLAKRAETYALTNTNALDEAVDLIKASKKPFLLVGGGAIRAGASGALLTLAEKMGCPVACTLMGIGVFPADHPQYVGGIGMHGTAAANVASSEADLFIALGARFNERVSGQPDQFAQKAQVLHIDIDIAEIGKNITAHHCLVGDAAVVAQGLSDRLEKADHRAWLEHVLSRKVCNKTQVSPSDPLTPAPLLHALRSIAGNDALIATDVGQHQMWVAQYVPFYESGKLITSGGLGTMGFGLGAAIGAQIGQPEKRVVLVTGDGSFRMNLTELATAVYEGLPIVVVLLNNGTLGLVRQWQTLFYDKHYSATTLNRGPDFVKLAQSYGMPAYRATTQGEFEEALTAAFAQNKTALVECIIGMDEMVHPMVAPGKPLTEFLLD